MFYFKDFKCPTQSPDPEPKEQHWNELEHYLNYRLVINLLVQTFGHTDFNVNILIPKFGPSVGMAR